MRLEFKVYELLEKFGTYEFDIDNEFIKVGEDREGNEEYFLMQGIDNGALKLINGLNIQQSAYKVPVDIVKLKGDGLYSDWYGFDISNDYLNNKIINEIQTLNG